MTIKIHQHRWYPPAGVPSQSHGVYLLHGTGEHSGRYERLVNKLVAAGYTVGSHDHPGHGLSEGKRGVINPPGSLVDVAERQINMFSDETNSRPILFGHSLGGVAAAELVLVKKVKISGLILSAPAFVPIASAIDKIKLKLLSLLAPQLTLDLSVDGSRLTSDAEEKEKIENDPLVHGLKSASLVGWLFQSGKQSLELADELKVKTLLLIAGADPVIDSSNTKIFAQRVPDTYLTTHIYDSYRHEILNETQERRDRVVEDIMRWLGTV